MTASDRWWQRWYEAWLVVTGRYTFWHAWHDGKHAGSRDEYERIVRNGGDLGPLLCAAVDVLCPGDMSEQKAREKRAAIWASYKDRIASRVTDEAYSVPSTQRGTHD